MIWHGFKQGAKIVKVFFSFDKHRIFKNKVLKIKELRETYQQLNLPENTNNRII